jgi:hypothetical protein
MSFRSVCIALGVVTFSLTFAITSWQQGVWQQLRQHKEARVRPAIAISTAALPPSWRKFPRLAATITSATMVGRKAPPVVQPGLPAEDASLPPLEGASNDTNQPGLPPTLVVPVSYFSLRDPDRPGNRIPTLTNISSETLEISVTATDAPSGAQLFGDVTIKPWARADLNDLGLSLQPGDEIILHSPPYQDQTFTYQ